MLQVLCALYPRAPIYTLLYDRDLTGGVFDGHVIKTSFLQNLPFTKKHHRIFPLLMPLAIEQFDFSDYDLVISISASFAKGIITKPGTKHVCYCLTPPRFLWDNSQKFVEEFGYSKFVKKIIPPLITYLRIWDREASLRVNEFWSISDFIKSRVKKYYSKDSKVIYPPVNVSKFHVSEDIGDGHKGHHHKGDCSTTFGCCSASRGCYFLMAGRLVSYKRFDLAIKVFNANGLPLKIIGTGPEYNKLKKIAGKNIEFLGLVSDEKLADLYSKARACIFPQEEDFGIVPLESMASGRPVIAYRAGGATETVVENKTGIFFDEQTPESLQVALERFNELDFKPEDCRKQAERFDVGIFKDNISKRIEEVLIASKKR